MKVDDVITRKSEADVFAMIAAKIGKHPPRSLTPRDVVTTIDYKVDNREEAEQIVKALDATVSNAINDFHLKLAKKK